MAKADFYILKTHDHNSRFEFLCRLIEKATKLGHRIYIHTNNLDQATEIDDYLWTYKIESFLPHDLINSSQQNPQDQDAVGKSTHPKELPAPVTIGFSNDCKKHNDLLINLASELPDFYKNFERIAEIVIQQDAVLEELRNHYRQIKSDGIEALIHDFRVQR